MIKKYFVAILFTSVWAGAADFITGQAARAIFGQQTFTAQDQETPTAANPPTPYILGGTSGVAYAKDTLFVTDANRIGAFPSYHRALIYNNISSMLPAPAQVVNKPPFTTDFVRCPLCIGSSETALYTLILGGGKNSPPDYVDYGIANNAFRTPTGVATDGKILVIADTDNNRILIWNNIPTSNGQPADIILGQPDFNTVQPPVSVTAKNFRAPQGVWIQGTRLFVADTANNRVMVWNNIPTTNNQAADYVLGVPNFTTTPQPDLTKTPFAPTANSLASPVSVTSDGTRLYVTDLGNSRVLIWKTIPTTNQAPADIAIGQPDLTTGIDNNSFTGVPATDSKDTTHKEAPAMCTTPVPNGNDQAGNPTYPQRCASTLSFPRYALSDGTRLFVADGGNNRILVFNSIPTQSGQAADVILGQPDDVSDVVTDQDSSFQIDANVNRAAASTIRCPMSLAWDGTNLYAADPFDRRIMVFTPGSPLVSTTSGIVNAASLGVYALASVSVGGTITAGDTATITINAKDYKYTVVTKDTVATILTSLLNLINANGGDPNVLAIPDVGASQIILVARQPGSAGNSITLATSTVGNGTTSITTNAATVTLVASSATLQRGGTAAELAPGSLFTVFATNGQKLADAKASADPTAPSWPTSLGGVQLYLNGMPAPLAYVSPTQINAQLPFEMWDTSSVSAYVRIQHQDGSVTFSTAINIPVVLASPGIFAQDGPEPRQVIAFHASSYAIAVVDLEGTGQAGDTATITIDGRAYSYQPTATDTLDTIEPALIKVINASSEERVTAAAAGQFHRIILTAKVPGPDGNGISVAVSTSSTVSSGSKVTLTALQSSTCCASVAGAQVTRDNPAQPGEVITIYATGLGLIGPDAAKNFENTGSSYPASAPPNSPLAPVDDALVGGVTANVLFSGLKPGPGLVGIYEVKLQLGQTLGTDYQTQMFIAQSILTSNIVTIPIVAPAPPAQ